MNWVPGTLSTGRTWIAFGIYVIDEFVWYESTYFFNASTFSTSTSNIQFHLDLMP